MKLQGFAVPKESQSRIVDFSFHDTPAQLRHGDVVIAAITSCTNTSNPCVMLASALVTKKACDLGLEAKPWIKTSLAPGSGVVTKFLDKMACFKYLKQLGFHLVGYGCTTCIGNSRDHDESVASVITENDRLASSLVDIDFETEPVGLGKDGNKLFFRDIWPSSEEVSDLAESNVLPAMFKATYKAITKGDTLWSPCGVKDAYCLLNFGDSITTDHISPSGSIHIDSPAAKYLMEHEVDREYFNSYGSRRGNDEVMVRGTSANIRLVNKLLEGEVGPKTIHISGGQKLSAFEAAMVPLPTLKLAFRVLTEALFAFTCSFSSFQQRYKEEGHDTIILAGTEYGRGSARDWAAKGQKELPGEDADTHGLTGHECYTIDLPSSISEIRTGQDITVVAENGKSFTGTLLFDTEVELAYFDHGDILQYVIRNLISVPG
ncbi:hypothetical protein RJ639_007251 [Escallonia herrerae]|uniref:Aconitate hydratase n=1 Tax=Escallonia herrerae TaxID=1293975 RepID=A0AA89AUQ4_9ASTE|nr:hypothetical protein RJ639_007251 [Escallonia herrerae]